MKLPDEAAPTSVMVAGRDKECGVIRYPVLSVRISAVSYDRLGELVDRWISNRTRAYINVCTAHTSLECHDSPGLAAIVNAADLAVPDGMPLVWLGRFRGLPVGRVYGPDLMLEVCRKGELLGYRHFLYGATTGVLTRLEANLKKRFPKLVVAGSCSPPFRELTEGEKRDVAERINQARPDIVWVGLGTPKQDYWVGEFRSRLDAPVLIAVGAAFNFHAGTIKQAPRWMMRRGLEWLFRLMQEPRRLWRRYLLGNPRFICLVVLQWLGLYRPLRGGKNK